MSYITESEYKGNPMLLIAKDANDKFPFKLGAKKLRVILENLPEVQAFVEKHTGAIVVA